MVHDIEEDLQGATVPEAPDPHGALPHLPPRGHGLDTHRACPGPARAPKKQTKKA